MSAQEKQNQLLVFRLGDLAYGLPVGAVKETLQEAEMRHIPLGAGLIKGIMNVRGTLLPVVDSRRLMGLEGAADAGDARIILLKVRDRAVGLTTDRVPEVIAIGGESGGLETAGHAPEGLVLHPDGSTLIRVLETTWIFNRIEEAVTDAPCSSGSDRERRVTTERGAVTTAERVDEELVVPFWAAGTEYAVQAKVIDRVLRMPERLEPMPGMPDSMLGMLMDQGKPIPVWHAGKMLGESATERPGRILVLQVDMAGSQASVGLAVDRSDQLVRMARSRIVELPAFVRGKAMPWVSGLYERAGKVTFMLDVHHWSGWFDETSAISGRGSLDSESLNVEFEETQDQKEELYIFFEIERTMYGMRAAEVKEVLKDTEITPVTTEQGAVGILNLRGHLVTVVDMAASLGHSEKLSHGGRMLVVQCGLRRVAFRVDDVRHLRRLTEREVQQVSSLDRWDDSHHAMIHHAVAEWKPGQYASILQSAEMVLS